MSFSEMECKVLPAQRVFIIYERVFKIENGLFVPDIGGIQRYLYEISDLLIELGVEVFVVQRGDEFGQAEYDGRTIVSVRADSGARFGRCVFNLIKRYDVDYERDIVLWGTDTIACKTALKKSIAIQHGIACDFSSPQQGARGIALKFGLSRLYKAMQRRRALRSFESSAVRVCVDYNFTNWYRTFAYKNFGMDEGVYVIPNFAKIPSGFSRQWPVRAGTYTILFARRFVEKRGVLPMLSAARLLIKSRHKVRFIFAGDGPLLHEIVALQREFGKDVIEVGPYDPRQTNEVHQHCDIAVIPTVGSEGTSLSLLEAMANGCCVVTTPVGGISNIVLDGHNGLLVRPVAEDICGAIEKIIDDKDLAARLSENAINTITDTFSYERWKKSWIHVLKNVIAT